jgi:DNA topoisomerase-2
MKALFVFDTSIVNAADNKQRDASMNSLKVSINVLVACLGSTYPSSYYSETNTISVENNGRGIPIAVHAKEKVYVPELIFGHLLTSSNYDDNEKKVGKPLVLPVVTFVGHWRTQRLWCQAVQYLQH